MRASLLAPCCDLNDSDGDSCIALEALLHLPFTGSAPCSRRRMLDSNLRKPMPFQAYHAYSNEDAAIRLPRAPAG